MSYLGAAVSLVQHGSYRVPVTPWTAVDTSGMLAHFPPGFPTAIAAPIAVGLSPIQAARLIVALSAFASAVLLVLLVDTAAGRSAALTAAAGAALTPALVTVHLSVLSEPLFLALMLATMMACLARRPGVTGALAAGAVMVRYVGLALAVAAVIWFLRQPGSWRRRLREAALAGVPSVVLLGAWVARSSREAGTRSIRELGVYGSVSRTIAEGFSTVCDWLAPGSTGMRWRAAAVAVAAVVVGAVLAGAWRAFRRAPADGGGRAPQTVRLAALVGALYVAMLVTSRVAADPSIPFDDRLLSPLILLTEIALVIAAAMWWRRTPDRRAQMVVVAAACVWVVASAVESGSRVKEALTDGDDFASTEWRFSPTVAWVRAHAAGVPLYTNWPAAVYFHAQRGSHELPRAVDPLTLRRFGERLERQRGILVGFDAPNAEGVSPDSIASRLRLRPLARLADGAIWGK
ncbi:MAG TPA: hypothetical protein VNW46_15860 [Gemmatimonadaceae bacterium]|nr:hypothetical protein [Gemmatimonadaceae bacterium]